MMPKKRFIAIWINFVFLLFSVLHVNGVLQPPFQPGGGSIESPAIKNSDSLSCFDFPDRNTRYDSCYDYPACWMNGGCTGGEQPSYNSWRIYDYECDALTREFYKWSDSPCYWAYCRGDTVVYNRICKVEGVCDYDADYNCNDYDGNYDIPQCWMANGGGSADSGSCTGEEPIFRENFVYDYGCKDKLASARCEKISSTEITCANNPSQCHDFLNCDVGVSVDCKEECNSNSMGNGVCLAVGGGEPSCSDNTPLNTCSSTKPKYCDTNYNLVDKCGAPQNCGCPSGQTCQPDGTCKG